METGIRKLVSIILLTIISSLSLSAGDDTTLQVGLFPIERSEDDSLSVSQQYIMNTIYSDLYDGLSALLSSDEFLEVYKTTYDTAEAVDFYQENIIFDDSRIFSLEDETTSSYLIHDNSLDALIYGRFKQIDELIIFELIRIDDESRMKTLYSGIVTKNRLADEIRRMLQLLIEDLTGLETGELIISHDEASQITVGLSDSVITTPNHEIFRVLPKGIYALSLYADNKLVENRNIAVLDAVQEYEVTETGPQVQNRYIASLPLGASVSIDSKAEGRTPFIYSSTGNLDYPSSIELDLSGYAGYRGTLSQNKVQEVIILRPQWMDFNDQVKKGKDGFYTSLGATILSLPISIFSSFLYDTTDQGYWNLFRLAGSATTVYLGIRTVQDLLDYYQRIY